jgi:hypothetical protein
LISGENTKACLLRCLSLFMWPAFFRTFEMGILWHTIKYGRSENIFMAKLQNKTKMQGESIALVSMNCLGEGVMSHEVCMKSNIHKCQITLLDS